MDNKKFIKLISSQFNGVASFLKKIIEICPENLWKHKTSPIWQIIFHATFYIDFYSGDFNKELKNPADNHVWPEFLKKASYEDKDIGRKTSLCLSKSEVINYLKYSIEKFITLLDNYDNFTEKSSFDWLTISKGEVAVYIIRHIQSHASQMNGRIKESTGDVVPWVGKAR